ncbi:hypothetical protein D3C71_1396670 [compost metagenome]
MLLPFTLMPTGLLIPVANMSSRLRIGGTQTLAIPGTLTTASSSATSLSMVMPGRHWSRGLKRMVVSSMVSGAGSVALSALPALPNTVATSGTVLINLSVSCSSLLASRADIPGSEEGIYNRSPSSSCGINSLPNRLSG